jgi:hypothetical protein
LFYCFSSNINCDIARIDFYQQTVETHKKKSKKELNSQGGGSSNQAVLLGFVNIPVSSIESSQPIEKWYKLDSPSVSLGSGSSSINDQQSTTGVVNSSTNSSEPPLSASNVSLSMSNNNSQTAATTAAATASLTTTQNFSKDSISIRIKAKYQSVDILPLTCYQRLIEVNFCSILNHSLRTVLICSYDGCC